MYKSKQQIFLFCLIMIYQRVTLGKSINNNGTVNTTNTNTSENSRINFIRCRDKYFNTGCFVEGKKFCITRLITKIIEQ